MEREERAAFVLGLAAVAVLAVGFVVREHRHHAPARVHVPPAAASAGSFTSCGRTLLASDEALRAIEVEGCAKLADEDLAFLGCSPSGTWSMSVERALRRPVAGDACGDIGLVVSLTHFAKDGSATVTTPGSSLAKTWHVPGGDVTVNASVLVGPGSTHLEEPQFFDFDGDGDDEVIVFGGADEEGYDPELHEVWTFKQGAVVPYAPALGIEFDGTIQLDGDHRPDLVGRGPYAKILAEAENGDSYPIAPSMFVARSMPDGTFDLRSPESIAYAKSRCGSRPALAAVDFATAFFDDAFAQNLVCARLYGAAAEELHEAAAPRCTKGDRCPLWVSALIDVPPPFVF